MKLIADAGATKISWAIIHKEEVIKFKTSGYNPNISDSNYLRQLLISGFPADFDSNGIMEILYCGAGCGSVFGKDRVQKALKYFFQKVSDINVLTDLEGAAKGMLGQKSGVIGILGTGANAGLYDGNSIIKSPPSVGFMLGDEGSGAYLGKELTKKILRNELSEIIVD
jgi:glucosamine kinase